MADLLDIFKTSISDEILGQLASQLDIKEKKKVGAAASETCSILLDAMQRNATKEGGMSSLSNALEQDHDGSIMDDLLGYKSGVGIFLSEPRTELGY